LPTPGVSPRVTHLTEWEYVGKGRTSASCLPSKHPVERVGGVIDDGFGPVGEGVEVFEGEIAAVIDGVEGGEDGGPVGGAVEEQAEGVEIELVDFFAVFLEMDVLDPLAKQRNPVLG